ncbi:hypothetical protein [Virgibacillus ihumii]|uniref:hypothetical protein n=1 Tax=Virgibacillus ihumii TaxID=2686091 RepID=UPI00157D6B4E|nr:hypothetical protein [Virgibacillus ihumii]
MQKETTFGRTKEEALSRMGDLMIRKHPDAIYSRSEVEVSEYGNEESEDKYVAEYIF